MLVLHRKPDGEVVIGEGESAVRLVVLGVGKGGVTLGFAGPESVPIDRLEVRERVEREGRRPRGGGA